MKKNVESVKVALVSESFAAGNTVYAHKLPVALGDLEVVVLLGIRVVGHMGLNDSALWTWAVWRKSDRDWPHASLAGNYLEQEADIVAHGTLAHEFLTSGRTLGPVVDDFVFPYPLVLIRPPQWLAYSVSYSGVILSAAFYYVTQKVSRDEMTRLMVKDHA